MPLRLAFVLLVLAEIAAFIVVGGEIGVLGTLALVVTSALAGSMLLRVTGVATLMKIRSEIEARRMPGRAMADGALMALGSILLIVPGFVSDILGLMLLLPPVRAAAFRWIGRRVSVREMGPQTARAPSGPKTIELRDEDYSSGPRPQSPWRNHESR